MAKFSTTLTPRIQKFIEAQNIFFVATAPEKGCINLSPKGMDSFRVLSDNKVAWLNVTGKGNETAAHLLENNRITLMFCSFEGAPNIIRIYGRAKEIKPNDADWETAITKFNNLPGARQIFEVHIEQIQTSCGMSIPLFQYMGERNQLNDWAEEKGQDGIKQYWKENNQTSIDGLPTNILD